AARLPTLATATESGWQGMAACAAHESAWLARLLPPRLPISRTLNLGFPPFSPNKGRMPVARRPPVRTRRLRIIAQDPAVRVGDKTLPAQAEVPAEDLQPGPWAFRVQVIDYDPSTGTLLKPLEDKAGPGGAFVDPFATSTDKTLLSDPRFHAQNAYAIV